jgi:hypothetical protein
MFTAGEAMMVGLVPGLGPVTLSVGRDQTK